MSVRIATFNAENLFARYRFRSNFDPEQADGFTINDLAFDVYNETEKRITAEAIREVNADIIALQEIESLPLLDRFNSELLARLGYRHRLLIDSHDPRYIDVAVLSRYPFAHIETHRDERNKANTGWLFSRDCLVVDVAVDGKTLTLYVNHFKSMMGGRAATKARREEQAQRVATVVDARWRPKNYVGNFVIFGDLNDYMDANTGIAAVVQHPQVENVLDRLPAKDRWTHYYAGGGEYRQLDYLLLSKTLAQNSPGSPEVMRKGLPYRATGYEGQRFDSVGEDNPKASDHAPLLMDVQVV